MILDQARQLIQLQLELLHVRQVFGAHVAAEHEMLEQLERARLVALHKTGKEKQLKIRS